MVDDGISVVTHSSTLSKELTMVAMAPLDRSRALCGGADRQIYVNTALVKISRVDRR